MPQSHRYDINQQHPLRYSYVNYFIIFSCLKRKIDCKQDMGQLLLLHCSCQGFNSQARLTIRNISSDFTQKNRLMLLIAI